MIVVQEKLGSIDFIDYRRPLLYQYITNPEAWEVLRPCRVVIIPHPPLSHSIAPFNQKLIAAPFSLQPYLWDKQTCGWNPRSIAWLRVLFRSHCRIHLKNQLNSIYLPLYSVLKFFKRGPHRKNLLNGYKCWMDVSDDNSWTLL